MAKKTYTVQTNQVWSVTTSDDGMYLYIELLDGARGGQIVVRRGEKQELTLSHSTAGDRTFINIW